jgi:ATP-binding protein involved in chromosome partitioning
MLSLIDARGLGSGIGRSAMRAEALLARVDQGEHDRIDAGRARGLTEQLGGTAACHERTRRRPLGEPVHEAMDLVARQPVEAGGSLREVERSTHERGVPGKGAVARTERHTPLHRGDPRTGPRMIRSRSRVSQNRAPEDLSDAAVLAALRGVRDPDLHTDVVTLGFVRELAVAEGRVSFTLELTTPACPARGLLERQAREAVLKLPGVTDVTVRLAARVRAAGARPGEDTPQIRNTIAVSSGKGGVGKSTVAVNLALALAQTGARIGLLDADVYGPDVPMMIGARGLPGMLRGRILPVVAHGVRLISLGFFVPPDDAAVLRGPMLSATIKQFLFEVDWGELDYLVIDLPPGTGDAQLTIAQVIPLTGAVMVTTPQQVALHDVRKGLAMFRQLNVPILGVVENMSSYTCPHGERVRLFGEGGGRRLADEFGVPLLGELPFDPATLDGGDRGRPVVVVAPESAQAEAFRTLAGHVAAQVSIHALTPMPSIH